MRPLIFLLVCLLGACSSGLVYKPVPAAVLNPARTVRLSGEVSPWGLYFTAVTEYDGNAARVVVLSEMGMKLLDFSADEKEAQVYYKLEKLPSAAAGAFIRFAQKNLLTPCPVKNVSFTDRHAHARFETIVQGEPACL